MIPKEVILLFDQNLRNRRQTKTDTHSMVKQSSLLEKTEISGQMTNRHEIRPKGKA